MTLTEHKPGGVVLSSSGTSVDRRLFVATAAGGAAGLALTAFGATAAHAASTPKLPGEVSREAGVSTTTGGRQRYDDIEVDIGGDRARIFVPQSVRRGQKTPVGAVWFHHGAGGSHDAMSLGFRYPAELVVDAGAIAIGINAGGTMFTNDFAQQAQVNAWSYLSALYPVRMNFLRATSAGGALASYTYANDLIPYIRGLYLVNGLYDLEWLLAEDPANEARMLQVYDNDAAKFRASNPARIPASSWAGANVKVLVSDSAHPDTSVDPSANGLALIRKVKSAANEALVGYHTLGHSTPGSSHKDMLSTFARWSGLYD